MKSVLITFVKNPIRGKVKSRLAEVIGEDLTFHIYKALLHKTEEVTSTLNAIDKVVYYSDFIEEDDYWSPKEYRKEVQHGDDLGERMYNAFLQEKENGYDKIVIIGSDCYQLTSAILEEAFKELDRNDIVVGPAFDGGYYLLGMNELHEILFRNKSWGTSEVILETMVDIAELKLALDLLPMLNDVDVVADIPTELKEQYQIETHIDPF